MMHIKHAVPAYKGEKDCISAETSVTIQESPQQEFLRNYLEGNDLDTHFEDLEQGQAFFYAGKKKNGIFLKVGKRHAVLIMPNVVNEDLADAEYGRLFDFKGITLVNVVSVGMTFYPPQTTI